jgi:hypothetical protein
MMTNPRSQINLTPVIVLNEELQVILHRCPLVNFTVSPLHF